MKNSSLASMTTADIDERVKALSKEAIEFISRFRAEHPEADDLDKIFQCWLLNKLAPIQLILERIVDGPPKTTFTSAEIRDALKTWRSDPNAKPL